MKFPNLKACYNYYGWMVATQSNFNQCVGNKDPGSCLLILGRGGYAAAGILEDSAYYQWWPKLLYGRTKFRARADYGTVSTHIQSNENSKFGSQSEINYEKMHLLEI